MIQSNAESFLHVEKWKADFPSLVASFSTKNGGVSMGPYQSLNCGLHVNDHRADVVTNRTLLGTDCDAPITKWVMADQVHGDTIKYVTSDDVGKGSTHYEDALAKTDGLWTTEKNVFLSLCYADCVPIYYMDPVSNFAGVAHAGWKGTVKDIAGSMIRVAENAGVDSTNLQVAIGPSIGPCCYLVDDYVINKVNDSLIKEVPNVYHKLEEGQYRLDLKMVNYQLLLQAGLNEKQIITSSYCTSCEEQLFFSHRRDQGVTGRMVAVIGWKE
ncbi:peptidoglycan editing factor PgeF [Jeotgalibacillus marinus]|uniref:Purine nucleoside phosphorylase n=1 Tax=Jeotgalibacillus marinus TaxID=86667 RepID=A0ABV3Q3F9_9BACL